MTKPISTELAEQVTPEQLARNIVNNANNICDAGEDEPLFASWNAKYKIAQAITQAINKAIEPYERKVEELAVALGKEKTEVERHRERANEAQLKWDGHRSMDCAIKCCNELEAKLGTNDPVEAVLKIQELEAHNALLREALTSGRENCTCQLIEPDSCTWCLSINNMLSTTPTQSLEEIRSRVVDECVEAVKSANAEWYDPKETPSIVQEILERLQSIKKVGKL